jgi:hypothetical protein
MLGGGRHASIQELPRRVLLGNSNSPGPKGITTYIEDRGYRGIAASAGFSEANQYDKDRST